VTNPDSGRFPIFDPASGASWYNHAIEETGCVRAFWAPGNGHTLPATGDTDLHPGHEGAVALRDALARIDRARPVEYWLDGQVRIRTTGERHLELTLQEALDLAALISKDVDL
jgi:hypothetical protein